MPIDPALVGTTMQQYPLKELLISLAEGVAEAQNRLDLGSIETATRLIDQEVTIHDADGKAVTKSLLELGFMPNFYHFQSATIKVSVEISMKIEEQSSTSVSASVTVGHTSSTQSHDDTVPGTGAAPKTLPVAPGGKAPVPATYTQADLEAKTETEIQTIAKDKSIDVTGKNKATLIDDILAEQKATPVVPTANPVVPTANPVVPTANPVVPTSDKVTIGGKDYTLAELNAIGTMDQLKVLGRGAGLFSTVNDYKAADYGGGGNDTASVAERKKNLAKAIFDAAKQNPT